jgi:hypothetical protein
VRSVGTAPKRSLAQPPINVPATPAKPKSISVSDSRASLIGACSARSTGPMNEKTQKIAVKYVSVSSIVRRTSGCASTEPAPDRLAAGALISAGMRHASTSSVAMPIAVTPCSGACQPHVKPTHAPSGTPIA